MSIDISMNLNCKRGITLLLISILNKSTANRRRRIFALQHKAIRVYIKAQSTESQRLKLLVSGRRRQNEVTDVCSLATKSRIFFENTMAFPRVSLYLLWIRAEIYGTLLRPPSNCYDTILHDLIGQEILLIQHEGRWKVSLSYVYWATRPARKW